MLWKSLKTQMNILIILLHPLKKKKKEIEKVVSWILKAIIKNLIGLLKSLAKNPE